MKVLIVAATKQEVISNIILQSRTLITGVGMVNTAISLTKELMKFNYSLVINMGVAGSFSDDIKNGDVVEVIEDNFSEIGFEDDLNFCEFDNFDLKLKYTNPSKTSLKEVRSVTVNTVHGNADNITKLKDRHNADIESMEGASVFKVCEEFNIPCIQIRSISNKVEKRNKYNWDLDLAIRNLNIEVEKIIVNL